MPVLLRPFGPADEAAATAAHAAMLADPFTFLLRYEPGMDWAEWLEDIERFNSGRDRLAGGVRASFLAAESDGVLVGRVSVRYELNEWLAREGGHVGYGVLPGRRRRGFATEILRQAIEMERLEGVAPILVVCSDVNVASAAVIERCGGILEGTGVAEDGTRIRRYWI